MNIHLEGWKGRLGNNIIQVKNVIQIALYYRYNVILPEHKYFNTTYITINSDIDYDNLCWKLSPHESFNTRLIPETNWQWQNFKETLDILKEVFLINGKDIKPLNKKDLVIHIRGGDIFSRKPHSKYVMPPLSYFQDIISNKYRRIHLFQPH